MFKRLPAAATLALLCAAAAARAEHFSFDFAKDAVGAPPRGFQSAVLGTGAADQWVVAIDQAPTLIAPILTNANADVNGRRVLSVQSPDMDDTHASVLLFTNELFGDFTFSTRFKITRGVGNPSAGIFFRAQDARNGYVLRAAEEGNLLWYRVVNGVSLEKFGLGVRAPIGRDVWRELRVECAGAEMRCYLDGKLAIPPAAPGAPTNNLAVNDTTFARGKVGFWTASDSAVKFVDARVDYTPHVPFVQTVIETVTNNHPSVIDAKVYAAKGAGLPVVIGCINPHDLGAAGGNTDANTLQNGLVYYLKGDRWVEVTMPLRDRNGDIQGALKLKMKSFRGETEATAITQATLIKREVEERVATLIDING